MCSLNIAYIILGGLNNMFPRLECSIHACTLPHKHNIYMCDNNILPTWQTYSCYIRKIYQKKSFVFTIARLTWSLLTFASSCSRTHLVATLIMFLATCDRMIGCITLCYFVFIIIFALI
jgi:hypothetical protein